MRRFSRRCGGWMPRLGLVGKRIVEGIWNAFVRDSLPVFVAVGCRRREVGSWGVGRGVPAGCWRVACVV